MSCLMDDEHAACTRCELAPFRKNVVGGHGSVSADIMLVGEAPGRAEDEHGLPFVGPAGALLDRLLARAALSRAELWITNVAHCRPPDNNIRPYLWAARTCASIWLELEIRMVDPAVIVAMGLTAGSFFFPGIQRAYALAGVSRRGLVGGQQRYLVGSFHPAAVLHAGGRDIEDSIVAALVTARELAAGDRD